MHKTGISVVVVSWNTSQITDRCLTLLKKAVKEVSTLADVEVIVVDNASSDGSPQMIARKHPWVKLYNSGSNLGYSKGNNYGFKKTNNKYPYLLLLNNDAYVRPDTLTKSLEYYSAHSDCDVLGCRLEFEDGRFQPSAGFLPTPVSSWTWLWGIAKLPFIKKYLSPVHPDDQSFFSKDRKVGWVMGAFLFMKRSVFTKTNGFDENFFLYMEEVEWCRRVHDSGFNIIYTPSFGIIHLDKSHALKIPEKLARIFKLEILGLVYYLKKYFPGDLYWSVLLIKIGVLVRWVIFSLAGNSLRSNAYFQTLKEL